MSPHTLGLESLVTVSFQQNGDDTLMTLRHENLPDNEYGQGHRKGWDYLLSQFAYHPHHACRVRVQLRTIQIS